MTLKRVNWPALAAGWALAYGLLALYWTTGGGGFPFGPGDPDPGIEKGLSILGGVRQSVAAPVIAAVALGAAVIAALLAGRASRGRAGIALETVAWTVALTLGVVVPDYRPLVAMGHVPVLLAGKPFGWPDGVSIGSQLPWPVLNQGILMAGGALFALAALTHRRARRDACGSCGRTGVSDGRDPARWGRIAVWVAAGVPVVYAATRFAWALGIPLGFSSAQLRDMAAEMPGIWWGGAALGAMGLGGSVLTLGLIRPWGERFPRWIPVLRGRRVPVALAVVPAVVVAMAVTSAGLMFGRVLYLDPDPGKLAMMGPGLLWPLWGAALAVAAAAYRIRRRGDCAHCVNAPVKTPSGQPSAACRTH
ncbi:hypothetical protein ACFO1B_23935 [Dactylosporangium siamense]|uniref:DUF3995 domain-containing protein n=1 Tax=Dactylosporangium siamense TaxID=685454 RepID=A0A919PPA3_9ACTN|nr:hypothetical protein [Dactylosporangium siamense]GIG47252.1 hypothetical protein Dsi01nite_052930 [Dactylosporangium siamense]